MRASSSTTLCPKMNNERPSVAGWGHIWALGTLNNRAHQRPGSIPKCWPHTWLHPGSRPCILQASRASLRGLEERAVAMAQVRHHLCPSTGTITRSSSLPSDCLKYLRWTRIQPEIGDVLPKQDLPKPKIKQDSTSRCRVILGSF